MNQTHLIEKCYLYVTYCNMFSICRFIGSKYVLQVIKGSSSRGQEPPKTFEMMEIENVYKESLNLKMTIGF